MRERRPFLEPFEERRDPVIPVTKTSQELQRVILYGNPWGSWFVYSVNKDGREGSQFCVRGHLVEIAFRIVSEECACLVFSRMSPGEMLENVPVNILVVGEAKDCLGRLFNEVEVMFVRESHTHKMNKQELVQYFKDVVSTCKVDVLQGSQNLPSVVLRRTREEQRDEVD